MNAPLRFFLAPALSVAIGVVAAAAATLSACGPPSSPPRVPPQGPSAGPSAGPSPSTEPPPNGEIAEVWKSKCGACHTRVEPKSKPRDVIVSEMKRHQERNLPKLTAEQWSQMVEFMSP